MRPTVIAFAAVSGGGKTTITTTLCKKVSYGQALYFDDYDFQIAPEDIGEWGKRPGRYEEWDLKPLEVDLRKLINRKACKWIFLDYPFAYLHPEICPLIDFAVFIDVPLDIALARRLIRTPPEDIKKEMKLYLQHSREAYEKMVNEVRPSSDIVLDGRLSTEELSSRIEGLLKRL